MTSGLQILYTTAALHPLPITMACAAGTSVRKLRVDTSSRSQRRRSSRAVHECLQSCNLELISTRSVQTLVPVAHAIVIGTGWSAEYEVYILVNSRFSYVATIQPEESAYRVCTLLWLQSKSAYSVCTLLWLPKQKCILGMHSPLVVWRLRTRIIRGAVHTKYALLIRRDKSDYLFSARHPVQLPSI
jgi:hypothetical protein